MPVRTLHYGLTYTPLHHAGLLEPWFQNKRMLQAKVTALLKVFGMKQVEKVHTLIAMNWKYLSNDFPLLIKIMEKAYISLTTLIKEEEIPPARFGGEPGIPMGYYLWGVDVGAGHSTWQSKIDGDSSDVANYIPKCT